MILHIHNNRTRLSGLMTAIWPMIFSLVTSELKYPYNLPPFPPITDTTNTAALILLAAPFKPGLHIWQELVPSNGIRLQCKRCFRSPRRSTWRKSGVTVGGISQFLPLPHHKAIQSTLNCTVLANCLCQELNTFYSQHHKDSSVQQCQKCLGILLGFVYISLDVMHTIFSYIKDFHRIYH